MKGSLLVNNSIVERSLQYAHQNLIPLIATIEITQVCNLSCSHCYNYDRSQPMPENLKEKALSKDEILSVIDQLIDLGSLYINFSGGEALTHPHIIEFVKRVRQKHSEPRLKSNGELLSENTCRELYRAGLAGLDVSVYGFSEKIYEEFCHRKTARDKVYQGMLNAKNAGLDIHASLISHRGSVNELAKMISWCKKNEIPFQITSEVTERLDGSDGARKHEITTDQYRNLLADEELAAYFSFKNDEHALQCSCARSVIGISSTGDIYPCVGAPLKAGNTRDEKIEVVWNNSTVFQKIRGLKTQDFKECSSCEVIDYCNRSSGSAYINSGDYTGCDPSFYDQAKIQKEFNERPSV